MSVALFLEIKNEYTEHLVDTLTPYIYEGLTSIYKESVKIAEETKATDKTLMIFQKYLQGISGWNQQKITDETNRIKRSSNTADYLDDLVKAVIKSNIILLTYSNTINNIIGQSFYNILTTETFIHRCYTECGKDAHNNPYLFFHDIDPMDYKRNQIIIHQHIQAGITRAIRKILPLSMILKEYLINSANIIQEPPKVELVGSNMGSILPPLGIQAENKILPTKQIESPPIVQNMISENRVDSRLEREVMKMIKTESIKSDKQVIRDIMNMDKILTSMDNKQVDQKIRSIKEPKSNHQKHSDILPIMRLDGEDKEKDILNHHLGKSDKKILNINIEDEPTVGNDANKKSVSGTSLSGRALPNRTGPRFSLETSEKMDPAKVKLIEDYGPQNGSMKRQ